MMVQFAQFVKEKENVKLDCSGLSGLGDVSSLPA